MAERKCNERKCNASVSSRVKFKQGGKANQLHGSCRGRVREGVCPLPRAVQKQESFVVSISSFDVNSKSSVLNL